MPPKELKKIDSRSVKDFIHAYVNLGFKILPVHTILREGQCSCADRNCTSPGKHPIGRLVKNGLKDASCDLDVLYGWFCSGFQRNFGIATGSTSGIVVLDIDPRHGGRDALQELEAKHGKLPDTLRFHTGGDGEHILFRHPGGTIGNSVGQIGAGIDVRGDGGYIVAPPSLHASGSRYRLPRGMRLKKTIAELPSWLLEKLQGKNLGAQSTASKQSIADLVRSKIIEGQRNNTIARLAGYLLHRQVAPEICLDLLSAFNEARCVPPLSADEVLKTLSSIDRLAFSKINPTR